MPHKTKSFGWMVLLSMFGAAAVYVAVVFLPTQKAIARLNTQAQEKETYCAATGNLDPLLDATRSQLDTACQFNGDWTGTAPTREKILALLGRINALSHAAGAKTTRFDPEPLVRYERVCKIPLAIGMTGTFTQIFRFLSEVECLPQTIWIENLKMEKSESVDKQDKIIACELSLAIFIDNPKISGQDDPVD